MMAARDWLSIPYGIVRGPTRWLLDAAFSPTIGFSGSLPAPDLRASTFIQEKVTLNEFIRRRRRADAGATGDRASVTRWNRSTRPPAATGQRTRSSRPRSGGGWAAFQFHPVLPRWPLPWQRC